MKQVYKYIIALICICIIFPFRVFRKISAYADRISIFIYTEWKRHDFKSFPSIMRNGGIIHPKIIVVGGKYISIGEQVLIHASVTLCALDKYKYDAATFSPSIVIGNNCDLGHGAYISAINKIMLKDGVLLGNNVTIVDNSHGNNLSSQMDIAPNKRALYSKGPIIIEENVWLGDKVTILPNVTIGRGSIIGANSIVSKDIPPYSIAVGNPAHVIKILR
jgi:acetyltransferase-like isoleucine patch superfamily enzyme